MNKIYRILAALLLVVLLRSVQAFAQGGPPMVSITNVSPGSGTILQPAQPTITYSMTKGGSTVYFYVDGSEVGSAAAAAGSNQWTTPPLYGGSHTLEILALGNYATSTYIVNYWDWTQNVKYDLYWNNPTSGSATGVLLPWFQTTSSAYSDLAADYDSSQIDFYQQEGWVLLAKDFGSSSPVNGPPYFLLYNKYRGIVRVFVYDVHSSYSYGQMQLSVVPGATSTPLLTFNSGIPHFINDYDSGGDLSSVWEVFPIATGRWSYCDFTVAGYDPSIATKDLQLQFHMFGVDTAGVTLNGGQTINQVLTAQEADGIQTSSSDGTSAFSNAMVNLKNAGSAVKALPSDTALVPSSEWYKSPLVSIAQGALDVASWIPLVSDIAGFARGILGVFTGGGGGNQMSAPTPLDFNGSISMSGTWTQTKDFGVIDIPIPGSVAQANPDGTGDYGNPIGVFNLTAEPTVDYCYKVTSEVATADPSVYQLYGDLYLRAEPPNVVYNPHDGLQLASATAAVVDTIYGMQTPYTPLGSLSNSTFESLTSQYIGASLGSYVTPLPSFTDKPLPDTSRFALALQLKFTYLNSSTNTVDTSYFLKTYPVDMQFDSSIVTAGENWPQDQPIINAAPVTYSLGSYPNPFNPTATIPFSIATDSRVSLRVYDLLGQRVATLVHGLRRAGTYSTSFNGSNFASGVYLVRLIAYPVDGGSTVIKTHKILLLK